MIRFERSGLVGGGFAFLDGKRDGPTLWWNGTSVLSSLPRLRTDGRSNSSPEFLLTFNRPGASWTRVDQPERFGGVPKNWKQFEAFARRFEGDGQARHRARPGVRHQLSLLGRTSDRAARRRGAR
jgi:hypothetical protein